MSGLTLPGKMPGFFIFRRCFVLFQSLVHFLKDERSGVKVTPNLLFTAAGVSLACLAAGGLHLGHHLTHCLGAPDATWNLDPGAGIGAAVPMVAGTIIKKKGWEWDYSGRIMHIPVDLARDKNMFLRPQIQEYPALQHPVHTGQVMDVVAWQWPRDERVFLIPREFLGKIPGGITRDVIAYVGQVFRDRGFPENLLVQIHLRQLAAGIALGWGTRTKELLDNCLAFARFFTIQNYPVSVLGKNGAVKSVEKRTFGFIDDIGRVTMWDGRKVPVNKQWYNIYLSRLYADALKTLPLAPFPVAALETAHRAPRKLVTPIKNLAYYLAGRVPAQKVRLLLPTIQEILGYSDSNITYARRAIENVLKTLYPVVVSDFGFKDNGYDIVLSGKPVKK